VSTRVPRYRIPTHCCLLIGHQHPPFHINRDTQGFIDIADASCDSLKDRT
jgi:hypothetical protein